MTFQTENPGFAGAPIDRRLSGSEAPLDKFKVLRNHAAVQAMFEGQCRCGGVSYRLKPPYQFEPLQTCAKVHLALAHDKHFRLMVGQELLTGRGSWQLCRLCGTMVFYLHPDGRRFCLSSTLDRSDFLPAALHNAAGSHNWKPRVLEFLQRGFGVDAEFEGCTPLMLAARTGQVESFRVLLDHGADPTRAIEAAANQGSQAPQLQRMLLEAGCDPQELLSATAAHSSVDALQVVLETGLDVNRPDSQGRRALYRACGNTIEMVQTLLERGADPSLANGDGSHPLHYCASLKRSRLLEVLLAAGAPVNRVEESSQRSALYVACDQGRLACAKLLLDHGANPNLGCASQTPLMAACRYGSLALVELLLARGAETNRIDAQGHSAKDMASRFLPDLLSKATETLLSRGEGRIQHRWGQAESGEPCLKLRQCGQVYRWNDCHAEIVRRLS